MKSKMPTRETIFLYIWLPKTLSSKSSPYNTVLDTSSHLTRDPWWQEGGKSVRLSADLPQPVSRSLFIRVSQRILVILCSTTPGQIKLPPRRRPWDTITLGIPDKTHPGDSESSGNIERERDGSQYLATGFSERAVEEFQTHRHPCKKGAKPYSTSADCLASVWHMWRFTK